jgi:hypothetical protein
VLSKLNPSFSSLDRPALHSSWYIKTPKTTQEVDQQATLIKKRLERHQSSSLLPIFEALNQLSKGAQEIATSTALLQSQVFALQDANKVIHERKSRKRKAITLDPTLSASQI